MKRIAISFLIFAMLVTLLPLQLELTGVASANEVTTYHETFQNGQGIALQSGGAALTPVTDKRFAGNEDGAALRVDSRKDNWDGADFGFQAMGLQNGETYRATIAVYVDEGVTVPAGAEAYLQLPDGSYPILSSHNYVAGSAFTLSGEFTYEGEYTRMRVQSNEAGATVPFFIGDVRVTGMQVDPDAGNGSRVILSQSFEDGELGGWGALSWGTAGEAVISSVQASEGTHSLQFKSRADRDASPAIHLTSLLKSDHTYDISLKVRLGSGEDTFHIASKQDTPSLENQYPWLIDNQTVTDEGWTHFERKSFQVPSNTSEFIIWVESDSQSTSTADLYIDEVVIVEHAQPDSGEEPGELDQTGVFFDFEDGLQGWAARNGVETVASTEADNTTAGGAHSLAVTVTKQYDGAIVDVLGKMHRNHQYELSARVKMAEGQLPTVLRISLENSGSYANVSPNATVTADGWVELKGTYTQSNTPTVLKAYVEVANNYIEPRTFYVDDFRLQYVGPVSGPLPIQKDLPKLDELYAKDFLIGNAGGTLTLQGTNLELLKQHHNVFTAENAMKPDAMYNSSREFTPEAALAMVDKALEEGLDIHGHVLIWHSQSPEWLVPDGREAALASMKAHIKRVVEAFGDKVISWDVVNEAMMDNPSNPEDWKNALRGSDAPWRMAIGDDYVEWAFRFTKEVLEDNGWDHVKLYYNDYNEDNRNKATAIASMVKEINEAYALENEGELLIDGIGMQGHYNSNTNPNNVRLSLEQFIALGVEVSVTELDIQAGQDSVLTEKEAIAQGYLYAQLFKIYKEHADHIARVTFWGLNDPASWRATTSPLLFDSRMQAKPAYHGVVDPEAYLEDHDPEEVEARKSTAVFGTPVIDGTIDAVWQKAASLPVSRYQTAHNGANGTARVLWDNENLYVLVQVNNNLTLDKANANPWEQDSVEIFLDQKNLKSTFYQDGIGQYRVNYDNEASFSPVAIGENVVSATRVEGTRYTVELQIPLTEIDPAAELQIGFDVQINDGESGARRSVATWNDMSGQGFQDASVFGVLTLKSELTIAGAPTGLSAQVRSSSEIGLSWTASDEAEGYHVYRSPSATGTFSKVTSEPIEAASFGDRGLSASTTYYYKVTAVNAAGESEHSATVHATTNGSGYWGGYQPPPVTPDPGSESETPGGLTVTVDAEGRASATVRAEDITRAASEMRNGTMKLEVTTAGQARQVTVTLPSAQLLAAKAAGAQRLDLSSGLATVQLPISLFEGIADDATIELTVTEVDRAEWPADVRAKVGSNKVFDFLLQVDGQPLSDFSGHPVKVAMPYTLQPGEQPSQIVIYHLTDNGQLEVIKNGRYNQETGRVEFGAKHFSQYTAFANSIHFEDARSIPWASESVGALAARGIINGFNAREFGPNQQVTRAQFIQMLIHTLDLQPTGAVSTFSDVKPDAWYAGAVAIAQQLGIVTGLPDGSFGVHTPITRDEMAAMVFRAIQATDITLHDVHAASTFRDEQAIPAYAREAVAALHKADLITGIGNQIFNPAGTATRAQAAVILYNLLMKSL